MREQLVINSEGCKHLRDGQKMLAGKKNGKR